MVQRFGKDEQSASQVDEHLKSEWDEEDQTIVVARIWVEWNSAKADQKKENDIDQSPIVYCRTNKRSISTEASNPMQKYTSYAFVAKKQKTCQPKSM